VTTSPRIGQLHVITDTSVQSRFTHEQLAEYACAGGADVIQMRDKQLARAEFAATARRVLEICRLHHVRFIVNDRVVVAHEIGADGVHLGRNDMSLYDARAILGPDRIIGASAGNVDAAIEAEWEDADYVGFGHIFATGSKQKATPPVGIEGLAGACAEVEVPVIAIGGITEETVLAIMKAGARGIAVIGAVCRADDPRAATARLRAAIDAGTR
jgi:thiamine-phosphate pyrophosphorylase